LLDKWARLIRGLCLHRDVLRYEKFNQGGDHIEQGKDKRRGHYEVSYHSCGRNYLWIPAHALVECSSCNLSISGLREE
jgi:hypothetical protein